MKTPVSRIPQLRVRSGRKIAVPVIAGVFSEHFGSAKQFYIYSANENGDGFSGVESLAAPEHKPGSLPTWISEQDVDSVVVSAIGERALYMLADAGIRTFIAESKMDTAQLAIACLLGKLPAANGENSRCQGGHHHGHEENGEHHHDHEHPCHRH